MKIGSQDVVVGPAHVPNEDIDALHKQLNNIDPAYTPAIALNKHPSNMPQFVAYWDKHAVITPTVLM